MSRDNDRWIADLAARREAAVADLRNALLRNLRKALSHRMGVDEAFLEDAVQEALLRILQRLDQFEGRSRFLTWATSIAIRIAFGELRRRRWKDVSLDELLADAEISPQFAVAAQFSNLKSRCQETVLCQTFTKFCGELVFLGKSPLPEQKHAIGMTKHSPVG